MKKVNFIILIIFFLLIPFLIFSQEKETSLEPYLQFLVTPYLQHSTQTTMTIMWETNLLSNSIVEYGEQTPLKNRAQNDELKTIHEITLTELSPETKYFYRVISQDKKGDYVVSELFTFQTAVRENSPFSFVVIGDSRTYPETFHRIAKRVFSERPNFVLHVGDVVTDGRKKEQWIREYLRPASVFMSRFSTYVAIGNHERNAHWYYDYSSYPAPENYYSFRFGNAEFFIVDTNEDLAPESAQMKWLKGSLAKSKAKWKFAAHHHPPYSSDSNDYGDTFHGKTSPLGDLKVRNALVPLYEKYHVDIVWVGHIHNYERTFPIRNGGVVSEKEGVVYIQAGGGGAELETYTPTRSWFTAKLLENWQYCLVTIHQNTLTMMAYDIDGKMFDFLQIKK